MPRTVVYGRRGRLPAKRARGDGYATTLVKYVPAEVLAVFLPLSVGAASLGDTAVWIAFLACLVATPIYLATSATRLPSGDKPKAVFYVLSTVAFAAWATGISSSVQGLFGVSAAFAEFALGVSALLIPALDRLITVVALREVDRCPGANIAACSIDVGDQQVKAFAGFFKKKGKDLQNASVTTNADLCKNLSSTIRNIIESCGPFILCCPDNADQQVIDVLCDPFGLYCRWGGGGDPIWCPSEQEWMDPEDCGDVQEQD